VGGSERAARHCIPVHVASCRSRTYDSFRRAIGPESLANTLREMLFIHRFAHVTSDPIVQGASPVNIIGKRCHEDCRNRLTRVDELPVEFEPSHRRHMDIGDQQAVSTSRGTRENRLQTGKNVDGIALQSHEPAHALAKDPVIIDDRNQHPFSSCRLWPFAGPIAPTANCADVPHEIARCVRECHQYQARTP
jgi:hypothetical protein